MTLRVGSLFAGYGGLDLAVSSVLDARMAWCSEFDKAPSKILAERFPHAPNLGDVTKIDWSQVEPVDIITGGSPCQDLSHAGKRAGMKYGTRSGLWASMCEAIDTIRPSLVVWENVRGALSAAAEGGTDGHEPCLCGGPDRRRGVRAPGHPQADVQGPGVGRDDRTGAAHAPATPHRVGWDVVPTPPSYGALGGGVDVAPDRRASSGVVGGDTTVPAAQGGTGGRGDGGGEDSVQPGPSRERPVRVDRGGATGVRGGQNADARDEREGASHSCECAECGGCVDGAACEVGPCSLCMDDDGAGTMRALGRVLGDLAELGYDAAWHGLRAADVGAPHGRWRVFVLAWPATDTKSDQQREPIIRMGHRPEPWRSARGSGCADQDSGREGLKLLPTPRTSDTNGAGAHGDGGPDLRTAVTLLPTPAVNDMGAAYTPDQWDEWTAKMKAAHGNGNGHGKSLNIEALRLFPTPRATDGTKGGPNQRGSSGDLMLPSAVHLLRTPCAAEAEGGPLHPDVAAARGQTLRLTGQALAATGNLAAPDGSLADSFGQYAPAIARWEKVLGRAAPPPTEPSGRDGAHRLSPLFVEFMMGLPDGWVTDVDITRNEQLKALGNGVVWQQAAAALIHLLAIRNTSLQEAP